MRSCQKSGPRSICIFLNTLLPEFQIRNSNPTSLVWDSGTVTEIPQIADTFLHHILLQILIGLKFQPDETLAQIPDMANVFVFGEVKPDVQLDNGDVINLSCQSPLVIAYFYVGTAI